MLRAVRDRVRPRRSRRAKVGVGAGEEGRPARSIASMSPVAAGVLVRNRRGRHLQQGVPQQACAIGPAPVQHRLVGPAAAATASIVTPPGPCSTSKSSTADRIAESSSSPRRRFTQPPEETLAYLILSRCGSYRKRKRILEVEMSRPVLYPLRPVESATVQFLSATRQATSDDRSPATGGRDATDAARLVHAPRRDDLLRRTDHRPLPRLASHRPHQVGVGPPGACGRSRGRSPLPHGRSLRRPTRIQDRRGRARRETRRDRHPAVKRIGESLCSSWSTPGRARTAPTTSR